MILLLACAKAPVEPIDLYGLWSNLDADGVTIRAFEFAETLDDMELEGRTDVYHLYNYADGTPEVLVQVGAYTLTEEALVTEALWDTAGSTGTWSNDFLGWKEGESFVLASDSAEDGEREFRKVAKLP